MDKRAYHKQDKRQALLPDPNMLALYKQGGQLAVKKRLLDWLASYHEAIGGRDYDPSSEFEQAAMFKIDARLGNRIALRFGNKETRDDSKVTTTVP